VTWEEMERLVKHLLASGTTPQAIKKFYVWFRLIPRASQP